VPDEYITGADGKYAVTRLPAADDYQVCFDASEATGGRPSDATGYADQCYDAQPTSGTATPVIVAAGETRTGTDAALAAGGAISGTVTDAADIHHGLAYVQVMVWSPSTQASGWAMTEANGSWLVKGLPAGTDYQVCFNGYSATGGSSDATGYAEQCWQNQQSNSGTQTPVTVTTGQTRAGINAALVAYSVP
jgi:hypothetical protein